MDMTSGASRGVPASSLRKMLVPLALAQFICSFAGSNMNVMINDISHGPGHRPSRASRSRSRSSCW